MFQPIQLKRMTKSKMKNRQIKFIAAICLVALFGWIPAAGGRAMTKGKVLYRVGLVKDKTKTVAVKQNGKDLELSLDGFGSPVALKVNGGGIETCRTILEHKSDKATVILSLPIATPNTPCQMTAGFVSVNSRTYKISLTEETVEKTAGSDLQLRKTVEKIFGEIKGE